MGLAFKIRFTGNVKRKLKKLFLKRLFCAIYEWVGFAVKLVSESRNLKNHDCPFRFLQSVDGRYTSSSGISCIALASLLSFADLVSFKMIHWELGERRQVVDNWLQAFDIISASLSKYTGARHFLFKQTYSFKAFLNFIVD